MFDFNTLLERANVKLLSQQKQNIPGALYLLQIILSR